MIGQYYATWGWTMARHSSFPLADQRAVIAMLHACPLVADVIHMEVLEFIHKGWFREEEEVEEDTAATLDGEPLILTRIKRISNKRLK